jgi:predicted DCC family thiol-disulfide oxidoreductase YuxK
MGSEDFRLQNCKTAKLHDRRTAFPDFICDAKYDFVARIRYHATLAFSFCPFI